MKTEFYTDPTEVFSDESLAQLGLMVIKDNIERIFPNALLEVGIGVEISKNNVDAFGFVYCTLSLAEDNQEFVEFKIIGISISDKLPNEEEVKSNIRTFQNMHNASNLN